MRHDVGRINVDVLLGVVQTIYILIVHSIKIVNKVFMAELVIVTVIIDWVKSKQISTEDNVQNREIVDLNFDVDNDLVKQIVC